jgi:hypothetical protein
VLRRERILNALGFCSPLLRMLGHAVGERFLNPKNRTLVRLSMNTVGPTQPCLSFLYATTCTSMYTAHTQINFAINGEFLEIFRKTEECGQGQ